jgi:hypothetical protein
MMKNVARNIDQVKKILEQKNRVKELSGILDGWLGPDLTVLGELRQEGLLMEHNKPRIVFLFETMLIITKPKEDKRLQFKTYIPVGQGGNQRNRISINQTFSIINLAVQNVDAGRAFARRSDQLSCASLLGSEEPNQAHREES